MNSKESMQNELIELDGYKIQGPLGEGGFGTVFSGIQKSTQQMVAIKMLKTNSENEANGKSTQFERFERETQLCAELNNPHIVKLLDKGYTQDHRLFAIFELVKGNTLKEFIQEKGPLPAVQAGYLMGQVLEAMVSAHEKGIVHRDLKPQNIMVVSTGSMQHVKVLDFGLGAFTSDRQKVDYVSLTMTHEAVGTPSYCAPEQLRGELTTPKSDIYAWALIFLECLTGEPIVKGGTLAEIFHQQLSLTDIPIPPAIASHALGSLLRRALKKNAKSRIGDSLQLWNEFKSINLTDLVGKISSHGHAHGVEDLNKFSADVIHEKRQITAIACCVSVRPPLGFKHDLEMMDLHQHEQINLCVDILMQNGAYVAGILADRIVAYFGYPYSSDTDSRRIAQAIYNLQASIKHSKYTLLKQEQLEISFRAGVYTGMVVVKPGCIPGGFTVNRAIELENKASDNEILISNKTQQQLKAFAEFEKTNFITHEDSLESKVYKVIAKTNDLSALEGKATQQTSIFGRDQELNKILAISDKIADSQGQSVLLVGEAGIGKSTLVSSASDKLKAGGFNLFICRFLPEQKNSALFPILEKLKQYLAWNEKDHKDPIVARLETLLLECGCDAPKMLPIFMSWLGIPFPEGMDASQLSPPFQKKLLVESVLKWIKRMVSQRNTLFLIEDLHWSDPTSMELISMMIDEMHDWKTLVLMTTRPEIEDSLIQNMNKIELKPISESSARQLVEKVAKDRVVAKDVIDVIINKTDGVPLFIEELTQMLFESHLKEKDGTWVFKGIHQEGSIPITLRDALISRLDSLGSAKETVQMAATIGREFNHSLLDVASDKDSETIRKDLDTLLDSDLIHNKDNDATQTYIFKHALIRDTAYDTIVQGSKEKMHLSIANSIESSFPSLRDEHPEELARHYSESKSWTHAVKYGTIAAETSLHQSASFETVSMAKQTMEWVPNLPLKDQAMAELSLNGLMTPAMMNTEGWASPNLEEINHRSRDLLKQSTSNTHGVVVLWWILCGNLVGGIRGELKNIAEELENLILSGGLPSEKVAVDALLAYYHYTEGNIIQAKKYCNNVLHEYVHERDNNHKLIYGFDSLAFATGILARVSWDTGHTDDALNYADAAVAHAKKIKDPSSQCITLMYAGIVNQYCNKRETTKALSLELISVAEQYGFPIYEFYGQPMYSWSIGEYHKGEEAIQNLKNFHSLHAVAYFESLLADIDEKSGDISKAIKRIDSCIKLCEEIGENYYRPHLYYRRAGFYLRNNQKSSAQEDIAQAKSLAQQYQFSKIEQTIESFYSKQF